MTTHPRRQGRAAPLTDRLSERDALGRLIEAVRAGESRALVVRGDPGVGKTVLLDHLAGQASGSGCRVGRAVGVQSEMELAFAGLHQLCAPLLSGAESLPVPQHNALRTAFGLAAGPPPARHAERILAAAQASLQAGAFGKALELLATAEAGPLDEFQSARVDLLRGRVAFASGLVSDAPPLLLKAARRLEPFDLELARETYLTAWRAAGMAGHLAGAGVLMEICRAAQALPPPPGEPRPLHVLLDGLALLGTDGRAAATATLQRAAKALADIPVEDVLRWLDGRRRQRPGVGYRGRARDLRESGPART
jgi:hypothetical protein